MEEKLCRICFDLNINNKLITPCLCKGSIKYVHKQCINILISQYNQTSCKVCKTRFHIMSYKSVFDYIYCNIVAFFAQILFMWQQFVFCCMFIIVLIGRLIDLAYAHVFTISVRFTVNIINRLCDFIDDYDIIDDCMYYLGKKYYDIQFYCRNIQLKTKYRKMRKNHVIFLLRQKNQLENENNYREFIVNYYYHNHCTQNLPMDKNTYNKFKKDILNVLEIRRHAY